MTDPFVAPWDDPVYLRRKKAKEVLVATLVAWAKETGHSGGELADHEALQAAFPTVPETYIWDAQCALSGEADDAFLDDLANTIEGQLVRQALEDRT